MASSLKEMKARRRPTQQNGRVRPFCNTFRLFTMTCWLLIIVFTAQVVLLSKKETQTLRDIMNIKIMELQQQQQQVQSNPSSDWMKINLEPFNTSTITCIKDKITCRYDDIGDFLESSKKRGLIHKPLPCIPSHRRIPHDKANDWPYILQQRNMPPDDGSMTALMDYNTVLIPLYNNVKSPGGNNVTITSDWDPILLDHITGRYHPYFSEDDVNRVKYLSVSRSSNLHACKPRFKFYFGTLVQDFLGLSLLDSKLQRIEGSDIAINVDKWILGNMSAVFHDFRVVPARSTPEKTLKDQLFLFPCGHYGTFVFPMDLRRMPPLAARDQYDDVPWYTKLKGRTIPASSDFQYGDGMEVRFMDNPGSIKFRRLFKERGVNRGKNFHFFESSEGETFMEFWPHSRSERGGNTRENAHVTIPVNFFSSSFDPGAALNIFPNRTFEKPKGEMLQTVFHSEVRSLNGDPKISPFRWSFKNEDPKGLRPYMRFRGTSQFIDLNLNGTHVKVGLSHTVSEGTKDKQTNHVVTDRRVYLSQFYAFSTDHPFEIIAISGHFCFNHMMEGDEGYKAQWISERPLNNRTAPIMVFNETIRCPLITFANGMTEMIGDDGNMVIITYGVNDCYSRSILVPKKKIEMLLLGQYESH